LNPETGCFTAQQGANTKNTFWKKNFNKKLKNWKIAISEVALVPCHFGTKKKKNLKITIFP